MASRLTNGKDRFQSGRTNEDICRLKVPADFRVCDGPDKFDPVTQRRSLFCQTFQIWIYLGRTEAHAAHDPQRGAGNRASTRGNAASGTCNPLASTIRPTNKITGPFSDLYVSADWFDATGKSARR